MKVAFLLLTIVLYFTLALSEGIIVYPAPRAGSSGSDTAQPCGGRGVNDNLRTQFVPGHEENITVVPESSNTNNLIIELYEVWEIMLFLYSRSSCLTSSS